MTAFELSTTTASHRLSGAATVLLVAAVVAVTLARLAADRFYYGDLVTFFLPALFGISAATVLVSLATGHRFLACSALVVTVLNGLPLFLPIQQAAKSANGQELRVATSNVLGGRTDFDQLVSWSTSSGIDVLGQQEVSGHVLPYLGALRRSFPSTPPPALLGQHPEVMAWSKWQIVKAEHVKNTPILPALGWGGAPLRLELSPGSGTAGIAQAALVVYVLHPTTPRSLNQWQTRNAYLDAVAQAIAAEAPGTPIVAIGDFNTPTWSPFFQSFMKTSGLVDATGTGWPGTTRFSRRWFSKYVYFGSPVDHILVSPNIQVRHFEVGPDIGSDHFPVLADLRLP